MDLRIFALLILTVASCAARFVAPDSHEHQNSPTFFDGFLRYINPGGGGSSGRSGPSEEQRFRDIARQAVDYGVVALTRLLGPALTSGGLGSLGLGGGGGGLGGRRQASLNSQGNKKELSLDDDFGDFSDNDRDTSRARRTAGVFGDLMDAVPPSMQEHDEHHVKRSSNYEAQALVDAHSSGVNRGGVSFVASLMCLVSVVISVL